MTRRVESAVAEDDVRSDLDPDVIARTIFGAMLGTELLSAALSGGDDLGRQMAGTWEVLLPAIVQPDSLNYYREFLARQSMRASTPRR
jgi:hypothetical protein